MSIALFKKQNYCFYGCPSLPYKIIFNATKINPSNNEK